METSFLKLNQSRVNTYLNLQMDEGVPYAFPKQASRSYAYVEIPLRGVYNAADGDQLDKAVRNQYVQVVPACTVNVKGYYRFEVHPNPALYQYGMVQAPFYLEPESGQLIPYFYMQLRKDLDLSDIQYAVRIYMRA